MSDHHSSDEEVEEVERMIGAPGGLRIHRADDEDDTDEEEENNDAENQSIMQIHQDEQAEPIASPPSETITTEDVKSKVDSAENNHLKNVTPTELVVRLIELSNDGNVDSPAILEYISELRSRLSIERDPPIREVVDVTGSVDRLVQLLRDSTLDAVQFEAAWSLSNIICGTSAHARAVVDAGALPVFVSLLASQSSDVAEQCAWALGNLAADSATHRDLVISANALPGLLALCTVDAKITMLRNATWSISNLTRGKPQPDFEILNTALPTLTQMVWVMDDEVLTDACWALSYLSDSTNEQIQKVISSGITRRMVELLRHRNPHVVTPALRTVGNLCTGDENQTQHVLNCNVLAPLKVLLGHPKRSVRKEACWTISNITSGNPEQIELVINAEIIPDVAKLMRDGEPEIQKEAAWVISNALSGATDGQIRHIANTSGVIENFCLLLACEDGPKLIELGLESLKHILRVGATDSVDEPDQVNPYRKEIEGADGRARLERVRDAKGESSEDAAKLLSTYFASERETTAS